MANEMTKDFILSEVQNLWREAIQQQAKAEEGTSDFEFWQGRESAFAHVMAMLGE